MTERTGIRALSGKEIACIMQAATETCSRRGVLPRPSEPYVLTDVGVDTETARTHAAVARKPKAPHGGHVDRAWWPHSDDLTTELPDLLAVARCDLGPSTARRTSSTMGERAD